MRLIYWGGIATLLASCSPGKTITEVNYFEDECGPGRELVVQQVYNGTASPTHVPLSENQILAIGTWGGCSGTYITDQWVITAAHCNLNVGRTFRVGWDQNSPDVSRTAVEVYNHPSRDITLAKMDSPITDDLPVAPIAIIKSEMKDSWIGEYAEGAGYGSQEDGKSGELEFTREPIVGISDQYVTVNGQGDRGLCFGDSGGPLFAMSDAGPVLLGTLSNGDVSCLGIDNYSRVDLVADWVQSYVGPIVGQTECGAFQEEGRCFGALNAFCSGDTLVTEECADGTTCGWDAADQGFRCITGDDPCEGVDNFGTCDGSVAKWCQGGEFKERDCACGGQTCSVDGEAGGAFCVEDPCGGLDFLGECEGDVVRWCDDGEIRTFDCAASDRMCGYINDEVGYYCE